MAGVFAAIALIVLLAPAAAHAAPFRGDRDGDRVADDLEAAVGRAPAGSAVRAIVRLNEPATTGIVRSLGRRAGAFRALRRLPLIDGFSTSLSEAQARVLARTGLVRRIDLDVRVRAMNAAGELAFGATKARADASWLDGSRDGNPTAYSTQDIVAAVVDSGIDSRHSDLDGGKVLSFVSCIGHACAEASPSDTNGHGTHVAATIAGTGDASRGIERGVAPGAGLVGVQVLGADGGGLMSDVIAGLAWVAHNRENLNIRVVNLSLGTAGCSDGKDPLEQSVDALTDGGVLVTAAAGNGGPGACSIGSPGAAEKAITVGAMADIAQGGFYLAPFSGRGPTRDGRVKPDVLGPGVNIRSALAGGATGYSIETGTSMATAFVTGVAALMLERNPGLSPAQVKDAMRRTAVDWSRAGADSDTGAGRLDVHAALRTIGTQLGGPQEVPAHSVLAGSLTGIGAVREFPIDVRDGRFPLAVTVLGYGLLTHVDLSLRGPGGKSWRGSRNDRQTSILVRSPEPGQYVLRAAAVIGSGTFTGDVSFGGLAPPTAAVDRAVAPAQLRDQSAALSASRAARATARMLRRIGLRGVLRRRAVRVATRAPERGRITIKVFTSKGRGVASGRYSFRRPGRANVRVALTRAGIRTLRRGKRARLVVRAWFTPHGKRGVSRRASVSLTR